MILAAAAVWLIVVATGVIVDNLARWSSLAVFLLAIGIDEHAPASATANRDHDAAAKWHARFRTKVSRSAARSEIEDSPEPDVPAVRELLGRPVSN